MKQKLFILIGLLLMVGVLVVLNAVSYVEREKTPDSEVSPNRSTYNSGATGTRALYDLLSETGRKTVRWQEPPAALLTTKTKPRVFVVIGELRNEFKSSEFDDLLGWVSLGGRLVIIDREPPKDLLTSTSNWRITLRPNNNSQIFTADPSDQKQMTAGSTIAHAVQPSVFTKGINAIQPSSFASSIVLDRFGDTDTQPGDFKKGRADNNTHAPPPPPPARTSRPYEEDEYDDPPPTISTGGSTVGVATPSQAAPIILFGTEAQNVVIDAPYGDGRIVYVADPYMVSNGGIALADNAQMAINILAAGDGVVAFDEYHQGYGANSNRFLQFFAGTPVVAIFLQALLLTGLVFFSQSRRFARPVPEPEPDRLSKLEYVAAMAELQERSRAYDLAIENIYTDFRRRAARLLGVDNFAVKPNELGALIAGRTGLNAADVSNTLFKCEEIIRGEPTNKKETIELTAKLRLIESKLGLSRAGRSRV